MNTIVTTKYIEDELFEGSNSDGITTRIDMRSVEQKKNLSPVETLLSCLASCVAVEVVEIIKKKRKEFIDLIIEVDGTRNDDHPKKLTQINMHFILVSPDTKPETLDKTIKLVLDGYCSVASSLSAPIDYTVEVKPS